MAGIHQNFSFWAGGAREQQSHAPVCDIGMIKGGFEGLVLDEHALFGRQLAMGFLQSLFEPLAALTDVRGSGIVRSISEPERDISAVQTSSNFDAIFRVLQRALANRRIWIAKRAILIFLILKQIGVDRTRCNPVTAGKAFDLLRALHAIRTVP